MDLDTETKCDTYSAYQRCRLDQELAAIATRMEFVLVRRVRRLLIAYPQSGRGLADGVTHVHAELASRIRDAMRYYTAEDGLTGHSTSPPHPATSASAPSSQSSAPSSPKGTGHSDEQAKDFDYSGCDAYSDTDGDYSPMPPPGSQSAFTPYGTPVGISTQLI